MTQIPTSRVEPANRFPDCVFMKLHNEPLDEKRRSPLVTIFTQYQSDNRRKVDLKLTIRFGRHEIKTPKLGSSVQFGLRGGELKLKLENGEMPLETMGLKSEFATEIEIETGRETGREIEAHLAMSGGLKDKGTSKQSDKVKRKVYQCRTRGDETNPIWVFEAKTGEQGILEGQLTQERLGIVEIADEICYVKATFQIRMQSDLYLIESGGLLGASNLSRNKSAFIERAFFQQFVERKLQPHLSQVEMQL